MIIVPRLTQAGAWLVSTKGDGQHLAYAVNDSSHMLRVNSRKDGGLIATFQQVRLHAPIVDMEDKIAAKLRKGYHLAARWNVANDRWKVEPGFDHIPHHLVAHIDTVVADPGTAIDSVKLAGPSGEQLDLYLTEFKNGRYRLSQFEKTHNTEILPDNLPLWQTTFDTEEDAYNVFFDVRDKYVDQKGYRCVKRQQQQPTIPAMIRNWALQPGDVIWF